MKSKISRREFVQRSTALGLAGSMAGCCKSPNYGPPVVNPEGLHWKNWAETVVHESLKRIYRPSSLAELKSNVDETATNGWKLRVVGSGHSWSNLGLPRTGGAIMLMDGLTGILGHSGNVVEVEGGRSIKSLNEELFDRGLALSNLGDANPQSIAGATGTDTHGSGAKIGSLSEFIESMTIVTADGSERILTGDELMAGRVSLGKLGVVYSLKLKVEPSYFLHHDEKLVTFRDEAPGMDARLRDNRHVEYWYYPYTDKAARIIRNKVDSTEVKNPVNGVDRLLIRTSARYAELKGRVNPAGLPDLMQDAVNDVFFPPVERQGRSYEILLGKSNTWRDVIKTYTMEYQFPYEHLWTAFEELEKSIELAATKGVYVGAPIQFRFTKKSERSYLSHFRHAPTVSFSISFFTTGHGVHIWLPEIERRLLALDGKPHWGKVYYERPAIDSRFEAVRARLDPNGMFAFQQPEYPVDPDAYRTTS